MKKWTASDIPSMNNKRAIITGGTSGIGLETARELLRAGADVVVGADDEIKGQKVINDLKKEKFRGHVRFEYLNLGDLESVKNFADSIKEEFSHINILINNGGLSAIPRRLASAQGHELMFAVNYLGHFALTEQLYPLLRETFDSRIVMMSSLKHRSAKIDFNDLEGVQSYVPNKAYGQSKLAMLMFGLELARRIERHGHSVRCIPVHPGGARTHIFDKGPSLVRETKEVPDFLTDKFITLFGQSAAQGALPALYAATSDEAKNGYYYGPDGFKEIRGYPKEARVAIQARDFVTAKKLWDISEDLTGIAFDLERLSPNRGEIASESLNVPLWH